MSNQNYDKKLKSILGLDRLVDHYINSIDPELNSLMMEFVLHGLNEYTQLSKEAFDSGIKFKDIMEGLKVDMNFDGDMIV